MLSIVQRELKITARRPRTFRIRLLITVAAFLWSALLLLIGPSNTGGSYVFNVLTWFAFLFCLLQSVRRAASCISDEKQQGTLGLLFLTDLRGRDVIAGKLISVSAPSIHAILAFLPVLAITLVLGGTTLSEVARAGLVLMTTLLFSMSMGILLSTVCRESQTASTATLFTMLGLAFVPSILVQLNSRLAPIQYVSLWTLFTSISEPGYRVNSALFWRALLGVNLLTGAALALSSRLVRTTWQDRPLKQRRAKPVFRSGLSRAQANKLLDRNPGEWLCMRHAISAVNRLLFVIVILALTAGLLFVWLYYDAEFAQPVAAGLLGLSALLLLVRVASQASYALAELRANGAIELLLSTPLPPSRLIRGHAMALVRQFAPSVVAQVIAASALLVVIAPPLDSISQWFYGVASYLCAVCSTAAFGMWMGLREKTANAAFMKTIFIGLLAPSFFCGCLTPIVAYPALFFISWAQISGKSLVRLLMKDTAAAPYGVVPPIAHKSFRLSDSI